MYIYVGQDISKWSIIKIKKKLLNGCIDHPTTANLIINRNKSFPIFKSFDVHALSCTEWHLLHDYLIIIRLLLENILLATVLAIFLSEGSLVQRDLPGVKYDW